MVAKRNDALVKTLANPVTRKKLLDLAQEILPREEQTREALCAYQQRETGKWWPIIKAAGIKVQ